MRKLLILTLLACGLFISSVAQVQFSVGPGIGGNYSLHSGKIDGQSITFEGFGVLFSSQFDLQFSRNWGLLIWADLYSNVSATEKADAGFNYDYSISYLSVAPTVKYCISGSPFYLFGGPGIGFKLQGKVKETNYDLEADIEEMKTRLDLRLGVGYDFFLNDKLILSPFAGYNWGLTDVNSNLDWKISALQFGAVLRFAVN